MGKMAEGFPRLVEDVLKIKEVRRTYELKKSQQHNLEWCPGDHYSGLETKVVEIKGVTLKELFTFILCDECFVHMYVCTQCVSSAQEGRREQRIHWN